MDFVAVGGFGFYAYRLKQSHAKMVALLASGNLKLEVENGTDIKELKVPKQCLDCTNNGVLLKDNEDFALLIIGSCLMGIVSSWESV